MASLRDKVIEARYRSSKRNVALDAYDTVRRNAKAADVTLSAPEKKKATETLRPRMAQDRKKTAARGMAIQKVQEKKAAAKRAAAAIGNSPAAKKTAKAVVKKKAK